MNLTSSGVTAAGCRVVTGGLLNVMVVRWPGDHCASKSIYPRCLDLLQCRCVLRQHRYTNLDVNGHLRRIISAHYRRSTTILSPNPPNCGVTVLEWDMRGMEARLSGRFRTVGVSGRSAVVAWSPSVRGRTQQDRRRSLAGLARVWGTLG